MTASIPIKADSAVTTIIVQRPLQQHVQAYESWLNEIVPKAQTAMGHRGVNVIRPHGQSDAYTIVLHFDSEINLRNWLESTTRRDLINKVRPLLNEEETIAIQSGLEFWFSPPPGHRAASPYKQFLITWSAIFPLSFLISQLLALLIPTASFFALPLAKSFIASLLVVSLMTFVVMPRYTKLVAKWLYQTQSF